MHTAFLSGRDLLNAGHGAGYNLVEPATASGDCVNEASSKYVSSGLGLCALALPVHIASFKANQNSWSALPRQLISNCKSMGRNDSLRP
jgi:hypothetical protein